MCAKSLVSQLLLRPGVEMARGGCKSKWRRGWNDVGILRHHFIWPFIAVIIIEKLIVIVYVNDQHKIATNRNIQYNYIMHIAPT